MTTPISQYPKLFTLLLSILSGFLIYFYCQNCTLPLGYLSLFLGGFFLAHSFTMGPAMAILLLSSNSEPLLLASITATAGVVIGNGFFYNLLRTSYHKELANLSKLKTFQLLKQYTRNNTPLFIRKYFFPVCAGILSATSLPDEFSVILIKRSEEVSIKMFTLINAIINVFGVTFIIIIGRIINHFFPF